MIRTETAVAAVVAVIVAVLFVLAAVEQSHSGDGTRRIADDFIDQTGG